MKELSYTAAMARLEEITQAIEEGTLDIDSLSERLKEAQHLLKHCKDKLCKVETDVNKILKSDEQE